MQFLDLLDASDAAGRSQFMSSGRAQPPEPIKIGPLHHSFFIHIGAEKSGAERLQVPQHFLSRDVGGFLPAVRHHFPALRIERNHQPVRPHSIGDRGEFLAIERGRSHDHAIRALFDQRARTLRRTNSASHARDGSPGHQFHQSIVRALAHRRVEIDHLNLWKGTKLLQHR